jgi:hypothetical protein
MRFGQRQVQLHHGFVAGLSALAISSSRSRMWRSFVRRLGRHGVDG